MFKRCSQHKDPCDVIGKLAAEGEHELLPHLSVLLPKAGKSSRLAVFHPRVASPETLSEESPLAGSSRHCHEPLCATTQLPF